MRVWAFFFSELRIRGLFLCSDSSLNLAPAAPGVLWAEICLSWWGTDAWEHRVMLHEENCSWKEQEPAQWSHWLRRTILEDFLLCRAPGGNSEAAQRKWVHLLKNEKVSQPQLFSFDIHTTFQLPFLSQIIASQGPQEVDREIVRLLGGVRTELPVIYKLVIAAQQWRTKQPPNGIPSASSSHSFK